MKNYAGIQQRLMVQTYPNRGIVIVKGSGVFLYDQNGKKYLDLMSNIGVNILGHNNQYLNTSITKQLGRLSNLHCSLPNDVRSTLLQKLRQFLPKHLTHFYFSSTGTEAIEAALKFAVLTTKKYKFMGAKGSYHGKTLGSLSLTTSSSEKYQKPFQKILIKNSFIDFGNLIDLEKKLDNSFAAVVLEPIQGEGGIIVPPKGYLKGVAKICKQNDRLLILDEIQTGAGRTGKFLASSYEDIKPDIVCLSKGIGGGLPFAITAVTDEINKKIPRGIHTSTFGGNPLSCAACLSTLEYIQKYKVIQNAKKMGNYFISKLRKINNPKIKEIRGRGLMIALDLKVDPTPILKKLQDKGIIAAPSSGKAIRFLPPLIINKNEIDLAITTISSVLNE